MTNQFVVGETPYRRELRKIVVAWKSAGEVKAFTAAQLADAANKPLTDNLMRALKRFEAERMIFLFRYYTEKGGLAKAFSFEPPLTDQSADSAY